MQKLDRELATEIKRYDTGKVEKLTFIGSGTDNNVYHTESMDIIKEFDPHIRVGDELMALMSRNESNGELLPLNSLSPFHLDILKEKRILFDSEISIVNELNHRYRTEEDNMFVFSSDLPQTSLGRCHWCNYVGGRTLEKVFVESKENSLDFKQYFLNILPFIISLYDEIAFYHRDNQDNVLDNGILNLDIKPENLFAIKSQGDYIGIRNLDFGSLRRIDDKYENDVLIEPGVISSIRNYAIEHKNVDINMLVSQISSKFFATSPGFYDNERINKTILKCLNLETPIEDIVLDLKLLDILAAWKTFLFAFVESKEDLILEDKFETETELIFRVFADIFENNPLSDQSLFESYNIYSQLYEIMARSFKGKRKFRLTASKIANRLRNILCVLKGVPENKKTEEQRDFETMNFIYSRKDELLKSHNLTTIKDILNFCKMNNLSNEMGDIHWFLMKRDYIDFRLFPDIVYNGERYSNYNDSACQMMADVNIPFLRAYNNAKENQKLLLIGDGSLGKSTSLRVFEAKMLIKKIPCLFYECKSINANDISMIETHVIHHSNEIIIFDAYDELQDTMREAFNDLIDKMNNYENRVIISSRFDPRSGYISEATSEVFSTYQSMNICDFTDKQLDSLVSKTISRNGGYYKLLRTTMFLALHLELEKNNLLSSLRDSIKTEASFIQQYFELLYFDKMTDDVKLSDLIHLGEYVHKQRRGEKNRYLERIPNPLKHIFDYGVISVSDDKNLETHLISHQVKYLNYLHALYLKEQLLSLYEDTNIEEFTFSAQRLLNMPSTSEISESVYYAGQLLAEQSEIKSILIALNQDETKKQTRYENILCLFLGYNHDIAEDIPGVFNFFHPIMTDNYHDYLHVCDRIRELKANSIREIHFGYSGFPQLEKISIENDIYYSKGNCLIKRSDNGLFIGCQNSEIPEGVLYIHSHAFSYCDIRRVVLPPSVREVDRFAFKYCEFLEYVELGESVNKLARDAFYNCSAIKTVCIKNKAMQIGHSFYDIGAFVRVPILAEAIVPTSGVPYVYKIAAETLTSLQVFQGYSCGKPERLSLDCIKPPARLKMLKNLLIRKDVEEISEEAFIQLANNLESIVVEEGCKNYYSINNCLISLQDETLVLGCKNSKIPDCGVKRIKSYAFARCSSLLEILIPENVSHIGYNCFQECFHLQTVIFKCKGLMLEDRAFIACRNLKTVICDSINLWVNYKYADDLTCNPLCYARELQCSGLTDGTLVIPTDTYKIEKGAFRRCNSFNKVFIPRSLQSIGGCAFNECDNIEEIHIESLNSWSSILFASFSANPLYQGARLFISGSEAKNLAFDKNTIINKHSFIRTKSIETVTFEEGCEVGFEAFKECPNLKQVILKSPNVKINSTAFSGCKVEICFNGTLEEWKILSNHEEINGVVSVSFL